MSVHANPPGHPLFGIWLEQQVFHSMYTYDQFNRIWHSTLMPHPGGVSIDVSIYHFHKKNCPTWTNNECRCMVEPL